MKNIRIGCGAGFQADRIKPAVELAQNGDIQYLVFECLAERTIGLAQKERVQNLKGGYDIFLEDRMTAVLPICKKNGIKIITNMGAANPLGGMEKIVETARNLNLSGLKVAAVTGDDIFQEVLNGDYKVSETGKSVQTLNQPVSANAYIGSGGLVRALREGADIVIAGRVADAALFLAPMIYEFDWSFEDYDILSKGTMIGHLLECCGQVTGGYFADPGYKDVPDLARLGYPLAEVYEDGTAIITKTPGSGGLVSIDTCKEQLLYEIQDPTSYITPDVVADFSGAVLTEVGKDRVKVQGAKGKKRPELLKVSVVYHDSFIGEGELSYAGSGAVERGKLALEVVRERLKLSGVPLMETRFDLIGVNALHAKLACAQENAYEVRIRVAGRADNRKDAFCICREIAGLGLGGPAGGGGGSGSVTEVFGVVSTLIPRDRVNLSVEYEVI